MYQTWFLSRALRATTGVALTSALLIACSKENNVDQSNTNNLYEGLQTAVINANGGKLEGADGLSVEVPPNAVSQTITIAGGPVDEIKAPPLPAEVTKLGLVFTLQPHGQTFAKPVTINIPFKITGPSMKLYTAQPQGTWSAVTGAAPQGTTLRAQVDHFSFYVVVSEDPCIQGGKSAPDGTACGTDKVCKAGQCQVCQAGGSCALGDGECKAGVLACATGEPRCVPSSTNQPDGTACGIDKVCADGVCKACAEGKACTVAEFPCKQALTTCASGKSVCEAQAADRPNGESCGDGKTCFNGDCIECTSGAACAGPNPCQLAAIACGSGQPICEEIGKNAADGTACGEGQVCLDGACQACDEGAACSLPASPCKEAALSCSTGTAVCKATTKNVADGTECGAGKVCGKGVCVACEQDKACTPTDACHVGKTQCSGGSAVCEDTGALAPAGTACGTGQACDESGACIKIDGVLSVLSGDKGSALINQTVAVPLSVKLTGTGGTAVGNKPVTVTPPPGATVEPAEATTNSQGKATFVLRVGRQVGAYEYTVSSPGAAPITVSATATEPAAGTVIPIVNATQSSGNYKAATTAINAPSTAMTVMAVASDGTLYVGTSYKQVFRVTPAGAWEHVAGDLTVDSPPGGDGGPAKSAVFNQLTQLALDEAAGVLYAIDRQNSNYEHLRAIDLAQGTIDYLGGEGSQANGDGGPMIQAQLFDVAAMRVGPGGLYIRDSSGNIRLYDPVSTIISVWKQSGPTSKGNYFCSIFGVPTFDANQVPYFFAKLASNVSVCSSTAPSIVRDGSTKSLALTSTTVAGTNSQEGYSLDSSVQGLVDLDMDKGGNLIGATNFGVFRIDGSTWRLDRLMGDFTTSTSTGNYGPAKAATLFARRSGMDGAGNVYVLETSTVRSIWKAGAAAPTPVTLTKAAGDSQSALITSGVAAPLKVKVTSGGGNAVFADVPVQWSAGSSGAVVIEQGKTDTNGESSTSAMVGIRPGSYGVEASMLDIHGTPVGDKVTFTLTATAPKAGDAYGLLNPAGNAGLPQLPASSLATTSLDARAVVGAPDGSFYYADSFTVAHVSKTGYATRIAGGISTGGSKGDNGPAADATFEGVRALALDEPNQRLYVLDTNRVRKIDLKTGTISLFAGGGSAPAPGLGDGAVATSAELNDISYSDMQVGSDGTLYLLSASRVRKVDPATGVISTWFDAPAYKTAAIDMSCAQSTHGLAIDAQDTLYFAHWARGTEVDSPGNCLIALFKRTQGGVVSHLMGKATGTLTTDVLAKNAVGFGSYPNGIFVDGAGNIFLSAVESRVRRIDQATGMLTTVYGTLSSPGKSGLLGPATQALMESAYGLSSADGHLVIADGANDRVVGIW